MFPFKCAQRVHPANKTIIVLDMHVFAVCLRIPIGQEIRHIKDASQSSHVIYLLLTEEHMTDYLMIVSYLVLITGMVGLPIVSKSHNPTITMKIS